MRSRKHPAKRPKVRWWMLVGKTILYTSIAALKLIRLLTKISDLLG